MIDQTRIEALKTVNTVVASIGKPKELVREMFGLARELECLDLKLSSVRIVVRPRPGLAVLNR